MNTLAHVSYVELIKIRSRAVGTLDNAYSMIESGERTHSDFKSMAYTIKNRQFLAGMAVRDTKTGDVYVSIDNARLAHYFW